MIQGILNRWFRHESETREKAPKAQAVQQTLQQAVCMYSTRFCPYCMRARLLLDSKGVDYQDIVIDGRPGLREEMIEKLQPAASQRYTVPQIWIGDQHIGGCDELYELERQCELDALLSRTVITNS